MKKVKIGILGLGVVGSSLVSIIKNSNKKIIDEYQLDIEISKIFVQNITKKRNLDLDGIVLTDNPKDIINDQSIDVICECIGGNGTDLTASYLIDSLSKGKNIIVSSKKALALFLEEIFDKAIEVGKTVKYDATVGGGIPTQRLIENCFFGEEINRIVGIVNGTSNYIYTKMTNDNILFSEALIEAQLKGYAENDPSEDVLGYDAAYKLSLLCSLFMEKKVDICKIRTTPISEVDSEDIMFAEKLGLVLKPIIYVQSINKVLEYMVGPCLLRKDNLISNVNFNNNIICINGSLSGCLAFLGQGAGGIPTASAMFDNLIDICLSQHIKHKVTLMEKEIKLINKAMSNYMRIIGENVQIEHFIEAVGSSSIKLTKLFERILINNRKEIVFMSDLLSDDKVNIINKLTKKYKLELISRIPILDNL